MLPGSLVVQPKVFGVGGIRGARSQIGSQSTWQMWIICLNIWSWCDVGHSLSSWCHLWVIFEWDCSLFRGSLFGLALLDELGGDSWVKTYKWNSAFSLISWRSYRLCESSFYQLCLEMGLWAICSCNVVELLRGSPAMQMPTRPTSFSTLLWALVQKVEKT